MTLIYIKINTPFLKLMQPEHSNNMPYLKFYLLGVTKFVYNHIQKLLFSLRFFV